MKNRLRHYRAPLLSKGKIWYVYYYCLNPETGKMQMFKDKGGLNYKELRNNKKARLDIANEIIRSYTERLRAGWSPFTEQNAPEDTYDKLKYTPAYKVLEQFYQLKKTTLKRRTWQSYKYSLDTFGNWLKTTGRQSIEISQLTTRHITEYTDSLIKSGKLGNKSINNHINNLGVLFNMAVERELITKSPLRVYKPLPEETGKNFPFSEAQKQKLKKQILSDDPALWLFVKGIYHLFIRPIELLRIKVGDVDLRTGQIIIHSSAGKNKRQLPVQIPDSFIDEIKALELHRYPEDYYLFGKCTTHIGHKHDIGPSNKPYGRNAITVRHTAIMKACGLTDSKYSMYGWKHTGNIDSFLAGVDIYDLMRQNRHHSIEQTMTYLRSLGLRPNINYSTKAPKL